MSGTPRAKTLKSDGKHIPAPLANRNLWVLWDFREKVARAPWQDGHMYPARWAEDSDADPRVGLSKAQAAASLPVRQIHNTWPFPDPNDLPEKVGPTVLLPHKSEREDPGLVFIDYDDVVTDGEITDEVWGLLKRFGGPVFFSRSGDLHQWVRGELPDPLGGPKLDLETGGHIEIYDHGRMTGSTWRHVRGTPKDELPEAADDIEAVIETYASEDTLRRIARASSQESEDTSQDNDTDASNGGGGNGKSPYYDLDTEAIANTDNDFRRHSSNTRGNQLEGPHPYHGPDSGTGHSTCTNFGVETSDNVWRCWLHHGSGEGAGPLGLVAVMEGVANCGDEGRIHSDPKKMLKTCLYAREKYAPGLKDEKPPYKALVGVAELVGLEYADESKSRLGKQSYKMARKLYDDLSPSDL